MSKFISFAQNFEDVILWRALKDIDQGFYIDVGANDPDMDSVTKAFYDRGWRGINIEPIEEWFQKLEAKRPRDINLPIAGGSAAGELVIHELEGTGLSTSDAATAKRHAKERGYKGKARTVPVESLNTLCERYHLAPIHFLKIDVEGAEKAVLEGIDLERIRPWIIVVESTLPNSPIEDFEGWEPLIIKARYDFVYFDGLNRYYLSEEHQDLKSRFRVPPNVFDDFVTSREVLLETQMHEALAQSRRTEVWAKELSSRLDLEVKRAEDFHQRVVSLEGIRQQLHARNTELDVQMGQLYRDLCDRDEELAVIYGSLSWRLTVPVRWLGLQLRLLHEYGWRTRFDHLYRRLLGIPELSPEDAITDADQMVSDLSPLAARLYRRMTLSSQSKSDEIS